MTTTATTIASYNRNSTYWKQKRRGKTIFHEYIEKPAMFDLLPDLKGKKVLCVGVGTGEEVLELQRRGAIVTGIDISENMIATAKESIQDAELYVMDMHNLDYIDDHFDFVYSSLAIHYAPDWQLVFQEIHRVLKSGGLFQFSSTHPTSESMMHENTDEEKKALLGRVKNKIMNTEIYYGDYFIEELKRNNWEGDNFVVEFYKKTLDTIFTDFIAAGFEVTAFKEPKPIPEGKLFDPIRYERYMKFPLFIILQGKKK